MKKQRILSLLLSLAMVFSLLSVSTSAVDVKTFEDVSKDAWYYDYVKYVTNKEYFVGTSKTTFSPEMPMNRAMFVTVLAAIEKVKVDNNVSPFADVPANTWYSGAVAWAAEKGVVAGVGDNKFAPEAAISREQMAVMMNAYVNWHSEQTGKYHNEKSKVESFKDADKISSWAKASVEACRNWGLIAGMPDGNFWPANTASRAEVATVIKNLAFLVLGGGGGSRDDDSTDYIKAAVEKSVEIFNDKMPNGADAYGSSIALSNLELNGQALTLTGTVEANAETIEKLANFAVSKAAEIVGALSAGDEADAIIEENKALIADKAEEIANAIIAKLNGFFGTSLELDNLNKASIKENIKAAYENGVKFGKDAWNDAFMVDGKVVTGDIVVSVGNAKVTVEVDGANLSIEGKATDAVKTLAVAIAKDLYAQLIDVDTKTAVTAIDPSVEVGILFSAGEYAEDTNEYPYAYTLTLTADLEGSAADNIEYWFDGEHNVNLVISEQLKDAYTALASDVVDNVVTPIINKKMSDAMGGLAGSTATVSTFSVSRATPALPDMSSFVDTWIDEVLTGDLANSTLLDYLNGNKDAELNNEALYDAIDNTLADAIPQAIEAAGIIPGGIAAVQAAKNPDEMKDILKDYSPDVYETLESKGLLNYTIASLQGALDPEGENLEEGESYITPDVREEMEENVDKVVTDALDDVADNPDYSQYLSLADKAAKLSTYEGLSEAKLSDLANAIETLDKKGMVPEIVDKFVGLIDMLPEDASVTVKGVEVISKAALAGDDAVKIVVDMLNKIGDLSLASFETAEGVKVEVAYGDRDTAVNFFINK